MALAGMLALLLAGHKLLPDLGGAMPIMESVLPWFGVLVVVLFAAALCTVSWKAIAATLVPAVVWAMMFGPEIMRRPPGGAGDLSVATLNVGASNTDPVKAARSIAMGRDLVALEEITKARNVADSLSGRYPHRYTVGTVGLWSRYPLSKTKEVDLGLGWPRALRAVVAVPKGSVTVYVMHLASARPGQTVERDQTLAAAERIIERDGSPRLLLLGDLNTATTDRRRGGLVPPLIDAQQEAGAGFGFTWPSGFPITRPDHILYRGLSATMAGVEDAPGSDHRAAVAVLRLGERRP
jgi:vancomycin resistance protein VanJ